MLMMIPLAVILWLCAGLLFDGSTKIAATGRATDLAGQAARAGADALAPESLRTAGQVKPRIDPAAAQAAAQRLLRAAGATGTLTVHGTSVVTVTVHVPGRTRILSAIGVNDASGTATASATTVHGATTVSGGP